MIDFKLLIDIAGKLGVIQAVKGKLLRQPDPATDKLVVVLAELSKVYGAIEAELVKYLSLHFDPQQVCRKSGLFCSRSRAGSYECESGNPAGIVTRSGTSIRNISNAGFMLH